jgi:hypothetical protein
VIAFTPATVKERKDDPFDKEIYLQKAVTLVKEEFTKAASLLHEKEETTTTRTTEMALHVEVVPAASSEDEEPTRGKAKYFRNRFYLTNDNTTATTTNAEELRVAVFSW